MNNDSLEAVRRGDCDPERDPNGEPDLLSADNLRVWADIVAMCKRGGWASINVASKQRMAAILAVDSALLKAHIKPEAT